MRLKLTAEERASIEQDYADGYFDTIEEYIKAGRCTCSTCEPVDGYCEYKWDMYNTDGDCLAMK